MKKIFALLFMSFSVFASPKEELNSRLALNDGFSADFKQTVTSPDGDIVMEGEGTVEIARPSLFRWETTLPDENLLVSDGQSLWYYSPFIEQVSIYWQEQATAQTPFVLLTRNKPSDWDNYNVVQKNDVFTLTPTAVDSNQGDFLIHITDQGIVKGFDVIEQDGQKGQFVFNNVTLDTPKTDRFTFEAPDGVEIDDQRN
ncbi:outer membrane lipoprotein chaperone LolA [Vibrio sp. 99-70-13A1]|uniref:outer membrane lipoprotein chaperone LolA n=1 Tax=Vibrio sp. 99-70-13A1 TaxID=2607601 RepID=UPI0014934142|nr:outer membrane lipoprotein chaperone LolA [Vibrio sp. 99-70-13A1]NOH96742.1 outer membrane lipoprotein chaperone LolA [Vibrio sp. 99-70-13A1]